jgi:tellurite methyltransferase
MRGDQGSTGRPGSAPLLHPDRLLISRLVATSGSFSDRVTTVLLPGLGHPNGVARHGRQSLVARLERDGGYDDGYASCGCFWGSQPGSLIRLHYLEGSDAPRRVLDLGCGEGKNAAYFAQRGAEVYAVDCSALALRTAKRLYGQNGINWYESDATVFIRQCSESFDLIIMYGLLHCLASREELEHLIHDVQSRTAQRGVNLLCAFNDRSQDLSGHPGFMPMLLPHSFYMEMYKGWAVSASDEILEETHPHNGIPHHHSLTRLAARKQ